MIIYSRYGKQGRRPHRTSLILLELTRGIIVADEIKNRCGSGSGDFIDRHIWLADSIAAGPFGDCVSAGAWGWFCPDYFGVLRAFWILFFGLMVVK
jgi:hypothetical protein